MPRGARQVKEREKTERRRIGLAYDRGMFVLFSNKLGCLGSIVVSVVFSLVLILLLRGCMAV
jgi:hypothetical protein